MPSTTSAPKQQHKPQIAAASVDQIRAHFPALERMHNGLPVAYFDGPGGTQVPRSVVEAVADYLYHHNANTHWNYPTSAETDAMLTDARQALADFVGGSPDEIVFGANATTLGFHVSRALGRQFSAGDEIVITELDHHANVGPWQALAKERGCTLRVVKMDTASGTLDWNDFEQKVNARTKLVAVGAASNALGTITDVRRAAQLARAVGASCLWTPSTTPAQSGRCRRDGLRFLSLLGLQVLRAAHRRAVVPPRAARNFAVCQGPAVAEFRPRTRRDGHAQPRGHRRRRRGGRFLGVALRRAARAANN